MPRFAMLSVVLVFSVVVPTAHAQQPRPIRVLVVDASADDTPAARRLRQLKFEVRSVSWKHVNPAQAAGIDVIFLATGWGDRDALAALDAKKAAFHKFVQRGGGLVASQPNPSATKTCTPALLPYPIDFHCGYDERDPTRVNLAQDHFITEDLSDKEMPFPHDLFIKLDPRYQVLAKQKSTDSPSLVVRPFGDGRVVVQTANENYGANIGMGDEILRRMLVWAAGREPQPKLPESAGVKSPPIKVFILAGQSNMEGKAKVSVAEYQAQQPATSDLYRHLWKDGKWLERDDVWIKYLGVKGNLAVGYGSPKSIGPELEFGTVVGDHFKEQVLLIKTAWGGRSLHRDFRSPSAGLPPEKVLERMLNDLRKRTPNATVDDVKKTFGATYRAMFEEINGTLANLKTHFPAYAGPGYELAGFIWFQGWNDMISAEATAEYTSNLGHFIRDVRKELTSPKLPFVIGQMGVDGLKAGGNVVKFKAAQAAVLDDAEFKGNVALVKTDILWDTEAEAIFKKGWRENLVEWNKVGSDFPYHYLGSPKTMLKIGRAFAEAVLELRGERAK